MRLTRRTLLSAIAMALPAAALPLSAVPAFAADAPVIHFLYSPYADYAPFFLAKEKGYFDAFGVQVELAPKTGTAETVQLLASGNAEAGGSSWGAGLFNSIVGGETITIVGTVARLPSGGASPSPFLLSKKAQEAGIKTVADLKGKRIGIPGPGGFGEYSVAKALEKGGLTLADVEPVYLPPPATAESFANGGLEAGWSIEPFASQIVGQDLAVRLVEDHVDGTELGFLAFNSDFVRDHEDAVVRFVAAYLKAARELDNGGWKDPAVRKIVADYTGSPAELFEQIALTVRSPDGSIDIASVREQEAFFRKQGQLQYEGDIDLDTIYRRDLLAKANELLANKP